jgi:DNA-binding transcriptional regulator YiaG
MQKLNDYIKENPQMKLEHISRLYGVSVSAISKRRKTLGIKHETGELCKKISSMLHKRNIEIAKELRCCQKLVACVRFKNNKEKRMNKKVELNPEQIKIVKANYDKISIDKLAKLVGVTKNILRSRMIEMKLYNEKSKVNFYGYDLDNGNGYFDLDKYTKIMY